MSLDIQIFKMICCNGSYTILLELDLRNLFIDTQSFLLYSWLTSFRYLCTTKVQNVLNSERLILSIDCIIIAVELDPTYVEQVKVYHTSLIIKQKQVWKKEFIAAGNILVVVKHRIFVCLLQIGIKWSEVVTT